MLMRILVGGFGGQGVVSLGKLIACAGMLEGHEVCCWPHYGAEMRGGTARCTDILSSEPIESPVVNDFDIVVAMNYPSLAAYEGKVGQEGKLLWNVSLISEPPLREDIECIPVDATTVSTELGNARAANIVFLGYLTKRAGLFSMDATIHALTIIFTRMSPEMFKLNTLLIQKGGELADGLPVWTHRDAARLPDMRTK